MIQKMIRATAEPLTRQGESKVYPYLFDFDFDTFTGTENVRGRERDRALVPERDTAQKAVRHPLDKCNLLITSLCLV